MVGKTLTAKQLQEMREQGDDIEIHDNGHRSIEGLDALVAELRALVEAQRANAGADMLRSESQSNLIALLQKLVNRPAGAMNMEPLRDMIAEMQTMGEARPRAGYEFQIDRDGQGFMRSITAVPIAPTIN